MDLKLLKEVQFLLKWVDFLHKKYKMQMETALATQSGQDEGLDE